MKELDKFLSQLEDDQKSKHTIRAYRKANQDFIAYVEETFGIVQAADLEKLTKMDIKDYQSFLTHKDNPLSASSVNSHIRFISSFLSWLKEYGIISKVATEGISELKTAKKLPVILTDEECVAIINACENIQSKAMISLMLVTGMRRDEICNARLEDLSEDCILIHGKGNKERRLPIEDNVLNLLKKYLSERKSNSPYIFFSNMGGYRKSAAEGKITGTSVYNRLKKAAELAGIEEERLALITPHKIRHTLATKLVEDEVNLLTIQEILGHNRLETTMRYAHVSQKAISKALKGVSYGDGKND